MKKITTIICIFMTFLLTGCHNEPAHQIIEEDLYYANLEDFYSDEILEKSYTDLTTYLNDSNFVKDNNLQILTDNMNEYSLSILSGFVIGEEFELNLSDYSTLNQQTNTTNEDVVIIRFEKVNYPYITYYKGLYTDQLVPTIFYTYDNSDTLDRIDFFFCLKNDSEWQLMEVIHHPASAN